MSQMLITGGDIVASLVWITVVVVISSKTKPASSGTNLRGVLTSWRWQQSVPYVSQDGSILLNSAVRDHQVGSVELEESDRADRVTWCSRASGPRGV